MCLQQLVGNCRMKGFYKFISLMSDCQRNCPMQKANGLQLKLSGASYSSMMSGMVLGYSCHPHSITNHEKGLAKMNQEEVRRKVKLAIKVAVLDEMSL